MNKIIITLAMVATSLFGFAEDSVKIPQPQDPNGEIRYYVMNKHTHEFVGFEVQDNGLGYKVVEVEGQKRIEIKQVNKVRTNLKASTYTAKELKALFKGLLSDEDAVAEFDEHFELTWCEGKGMLIYKSVPFSKMK